MLTYVWNNRDVYCIALANQSGRNCVDMYVIMLLEVENIRSWGENERVPKESFIRVA